LLARFMVPFRVRVCGSRNLPSVIDVQTLNLPLHAWLYLHMTPFSVIVSRTQHTSHHMDHIPTLPAPLPVILHHLRDPVSAVARGSSRSVGFGPFTSSPTLWPPSPALVGTLFPVVRVLYGHLRNCIIWMIDGMLVFFSLPYLRHNRPRVLPPSPHLFA
jgi:hypothetical protein